MKNIKTNYTIIIIGILILIIAMGIRQTFGLFLGSFENTYGISRSSFGLALAIQHLTFGIFQPIVGFLSDKYGAQKTLFLGSLFYIFGLFSLSSMSSTWDLHLNLGFIIGLALSATTYVVILGAISKVVSAKNRSTVFGIATAAGSFGMFIFIPISGALINNVTLQESFYVLCFFAFLILLLSFFFKVRVSNENDHKDDLSLKEALIIAKSHSGYWKLNIGFFVCGFHVAFVATHFPTYLLDEGIDPFYASLAFSFIGLFNIFGSFAFGYLGDKFSKAKLLTLLYFLRAIVFALMLILPFNETTAMLFGASIGLLWLATIPLTSGLVAQIFGIKSLATLYGIVFFSHQIGSFIGAWIGGYVYDIYASYDSIWIASVILALMASLIHINLNDKAVKINK